MYLKNHRYVYIEPARFSEIKLTEGIQPRLFYITLFIVSSNRLHATHLHTGLMTYDPTCSPSINFTWFSELPSNAMIENWNKSKLKHYMY